MHSHPLAKSAATLTVITLATYFFLKYLLILIFPFIISYILMRILLPFIHKLIDKYHVPKWLSYSLVLFLFWALLSCTFIFIIWKLCQQIQLLISNFPVYKQIYSALFSNCLNKCCNYLDFCLSIRNGTSLHFINEKINSLQSAYSNQFIHNAGHIFSCCITTTVKLLAFILVILIGMIVLCKDNTKINKIYHNSRFYPVYRQTMHTLKVTGLSYLKSQLIIICVNWFVTSIGFLLIHNPYFILIGFVTSIIDALPVLGSGIILCPVGIFYVIHGDFLYAAIMFMTYLITLFTREILEAKLIGDNMGILPFFMLVSIYVGVELFGICGIVLGPFGVVIIRSLYETWQGYVTQAEE